MSQPQKAAEQSSAPYERPTKGAWRIVVVLLLLSAILGVLVFRNLMMSERYLTETWHQMGERGTELSVEGCVDEVIDWSQDCEAMKGLCDLSVTGMMVRCLEGQDRRAYCEQAGNDMATTHFGVVECDARELESRHERSVCAANYRAIAGHCRLIMPQPEAPAQPTGAASSAGFETGDGTL